MTNGLYLKLTCFAKGWCTAINWNKNGKSGAGGGAALYCRDK